MDDVKTLTVEYYRARLDMPGWRLAYGAMVEECLRVMAEDDVIDMLRRAGEAIAAQHALPPSQTLPELERSLGGGLDLLGWGWVRLSETPRAVKILLGGYPVTAEDGPYAPWIVPLLEGLFTRWFLDQGAGAHLTARLVTPPACAADPFELEFGKH